MPGDALDVFIAYAHEDETLRRELEEQLVRFRREGLVRAWHERRLTASEEWRGWIDGRLRSADLILLLVSEPFLESAYCQDTECRHALERHTSGYAKVIPIIARACDWRTAPFAWLDTLPQGVGPVTEWHSRDDAWEDVVQGIRAVAKRLMAARLESTAEFRAAVLSPIRETDPLAAAPPEELSEARMPRLAILGGLAAVLTAVAAVWLFVASQPPRSEVGTAPVQSAEVKPLGAESGEGSSAAGGPRPVPATGGTAIEQQPTPPPPTAIRPEAAPDVAAATPAPRQVPPETRADPEERPPEEHSPPEMDTTPGELATAEDDGPRSPASESLKPEDFERSLGILAAPNAEGECLAALIAGEYALTSRECAQTSSVVIMGGNALTATRDEIFDLEPWQASQPTEVNIVKLFQGLGESYGFVSVQLEEGFEYESLNAYYVQASAIQRVECVAEERLAELESGGQAYVENAALDRYVRFIEEAADEAISTAGSQWAELLPEALSATGESLGGFVCGLPYRPPGNLVFAAGGRVVGIGYRCEAFDRFEPEVRDSLPPEIRQPNLDCIASLSEIREGLRDALETAPP